MEFYNKLNANERMVTIGAIVVAISWLVGAASAFGFGANTLGLVGAIAVVVIYYLKYSPTSNVTWPTPVPTIVLAISALVAVVSLLGLLGFLQLIGLAGFFGLSILAAIGTAVGAGLMAWGAWQDYQASPKTTPPAA